MQRLNNMKFSRYFINLFFEEFVVVAKNEVNEPK